MNTVFSTIWSFCHKKQYTKNPNAKYTVKAEISMKQNRSMTRRNDRHFLPASGRKAFVNDVIGNMAIATSFDARGD